MLLLGIFLPFRKIKRIEKFEKICLSDRKTFTKNSRYCAAVGFGRGVAQLLNATSTAGAPLVKLLLLMLARDPVLLVQLVTVIKCPPDVTSVDIDPH